MDVQVINPFLGATRRVFELMVGCNVDADTPHAYASLPDGEQMVNAVILIQGGVSGAAMLRFPSKVVLPVGAAMSGGSVTLEDAHDAIGELANMVTGSAKIELARQMVRISTPTIAVGDKALGDVADLEPWLYVPFSASFGSFFLAASIHKN